MSIISETTNPNFVLTPTLDMNGKYIKCGVRNNGNEGVRYMQKLLYEQNLSIK